MSYHLVMERGPIERMASLRTATLVLLFAGVSSALACSILVGDGDYAVGSFDAGDGGDARGDSRTEAEAGRDAALPGTAAVAVSSGFSPESWCVVDREGDVECWGDNTYGELGTGNTTSSESPKKVVDLGPASRVSVGYGNACALLRTGAVYCWGDNEQGQLGNGETAEAQTTPVLVKGFESGALDVSAGFLCACAVQHDGSVWCWGAFDPPNYEQPDPLMPTEVKGITLATSVSVGADGACALRQDGAVMCWGGFGESGILGNGTVEGSATAVRVPKLTSGVTQVSVGHSTACAVTAGGAVQCWGQGEFGQLGLGNGQLTLGLVPEEVVGLHSGAKAVATGRYNVCALKDDDSVFCWGDPYDGELGNGTSQYLDADVFNSPVDVPVQVQGLSPSAPISLSSGSAPCVVTAAGTVECWGLTAEDALAPVVVPNTFGSPVASVSVADGPDPYGFACAVTSPDGGTMPGSVECWGSGIKGQLGDGRSVSSPTPVLNACDELRGAATMVSTSRLGLFACALGAGLLECWGDNSYGELGDDTTGSGSLSTPVVVVLPTGVTATAVSAGGTSACAITTGGAVYCWGDNTLGELGNGSSLLSSPYPVPVPALTSGVTALSAGYSWVCALLEGGTVDCWGDNSVGQLGLGSTQDSRVPAPIPSLSGVTSISAGNHSTCATTAANILCWGLGDDCELGNASGGACSSSLTPVPVNSLTGASQVAVGFNSACAIVDGAAWCWGSGPIGNAALTPLLMAGGPDPVTGLGTAVTDISVGWSSACAVANGALQCWGLNSAGQLGNGGPENDYVATPVAGF
jgi:alpha-tubulin suppressor-like RCC1 family protein